MLTTKDQFVTELKKMISNEYVRLRDNLASGSATTFDEYKRMVGNIQGLAMALEFVEEASDIADKY